MAEWKVVTLANPRKKKSRAKKVFRRKSPNRRRSNPGPVGGVLTIMGNPKRRKKRNPFKAAKRSRRSYSYKAKSRRRRNPFMHTRKRSHRRRNPFSVAGKGVTSMLKLGVSAAGGAIGTRAITNMVLKEKNQGVFGYSANVIVALALGYGGGKFLGDEVGLGLMVGGLAATVQRAWDDKVSGVLPAAAHAVSAAAAQQGASIPPKSLGDVSYSDDGLGRALLGEYVSASFPMTRYGAPSVAPALPAATGTSHLSGPAW